MKKIFLRIGFFLSLAAAASIFAHTGAAHAANAPDDQACGLCRVVTGAPDVPVALVAPADAPTAHVALDAAPAFLTLRFLLPTTRGPPAL